MLCVSSRALRDESTPPREFTHTRPPGLTVRAPAEKAKTLRWRSLDRITSSRLSLQSKVLARSLCPNDGEVFLETFGLKDHYVGVRKASPSGPSLHSHFLPETPAKSGGGRGRLCLARATERARLIAGRRLLAAPAGRAVNSQPEQLTSRGGFFSRAK